MGREMGGRFKREGTYVYLCPTHADLWQKSTKKSTKQKQTKKQEINKKYFN